jgi:hypothetical protein
MAWRTLGDHRHRSGHLELGGGGHAGGQPVIIPSAEGITLGGKAFPSYVAVTGDGQLLVSVTRGRRRRGPR